MSLTGSTLDAYVVALVLGIVVIGLVVGLGLLLRRGSGGQPPAPVIGPPPGDGLRVDVIVNPTKVNDSGMALLERALRRAGADDIRMIETTEHEPGTTQAEESAESGADVVVACGGDGTVMACVTALAGTGTPLGIVPQGTGNLLARNLGIPLTMGRAARVAVAGARRSIDVVAVGDERFSVMAGMGFDAAMLRDAPEKAKARVGALAYLASAARNLREPGFVCTVTVDEQPPVRRRARTVLIGNVGRLQGGLPVLPDASIDDGRLDVAVISPRTIAQHIDVLWRFAVRHPRSRVIESLTGARVVVEAESAQPFQLDGDVRPDTTRLVCEIQPGALVVCVPGPHAPADPDAEEDTDTDRDDLDTAEVRERLTAGEPAPEDLDAVRD